MLSVIWVATALSDAWGSSKQSKVPMITEPVMFNTKQADAIVSAIQVFPKDNPWNEDISERPVNPNSDAILATIEPHQSLGCNQDMGYIIVPPDQKKIDVKLVSYPNESDPGPYPVPDNIPIENWPVNRQNLDTFQREGNGDRHALVLDPYAMKLYEFFIMFKRDHGWEAACAAVFDLKSNTMRPNGWTSADAAGLPIFPGTVLYSDVESGIVSHAVRVTVRKTRKAYIYPATHWASSVNDPNYARMGERFRLRKDFNTSGFSKHPKAILEGMKTYGLLVADNGANWRISTAPDDRIQNLHELRRVKGSDFEVIVPTGPNERPQVEEMLKAAAQKAQAAKSAELRKQMQTLQSRKAKETSVAEVDQILLSKIALLAKNNKLPTTPLRLKLSRSQLFLKGADAKNNKIALGAKGVVKDLAMANVPLTDRATIAAFLNVSEPDNKGLYGVTAFYLECAGRTADALKYYEKAGGAVKNKFSKLFVSK